MPVETVTQPENPPAFPTSYIGERWKDRDGNDKHSLVAADQGMTLRDYFAAKALVGYYSNPKLVDWYDSNEESKSPTPKEVGELCYALADALLSEREKASR